MFNNTQISNKISSSLSLGKQVASSSHSNLLSSRVEFAVSGNQDPLKMNQLKGKYQQFGSSKQTNGYTKVMREDSNRNPVEGVPPPRVQIFNPARVQVEWCQVHKIGAGLVNLGNTCFMNTVIQCLTYCPPLTNYLLHDEDHTYKCKLVGFCMICELQKHIKRALERHGQAIKPMYIYQKLKSIAKHFQFGRQEDAHEFLRYVIDNLWKASLANYDATPRLDPMSKETTVVNHIFGGYNRSQVVCLVCKGRSNTYDHFMDFILDIKNVCSLEGALKKFVEPEMLEEENAYKCPKCGTKVRAEKKFTLHRPPNVATFQFKRFDYNRMFGGKITKPVSYPERLDLRPYMSEPKGSPVLYKLNAVLVHMGHTCNSGHYYCYVLNSNGLWYLMDDARVHQVSLNQVLAQQAYLLFYVRVNKVPSPPSPSQRPVKAFSFQKNGLAPDRLLKNTGVQPSCLSSKVVPLLNGSARVNGTMNGHSRIELRLDKANRVSDVKRSPVKTTLVPYVAGSSSDEEKGMNGHAGTPLNEIPLPGEARGPKATKNWHVSSEERLRSPSLASDNSVNSTTDWNVTEKAPLVSPSGPPGWTPKYLSNVSASECGTIMELEEDRTKCAPVHCERECPDVKRRHQETKKDSSPLDSDASSSSYEWIEKTKETINNGSIKHWNPVSGRTDQVEGPQGPNRIVGQLLAAKTNGNTLLSWEGSKGEPDGWALYRKLNNNDDYNEELDAGKRKKSKKEVKEWEERANPFQQVQDARRHYRDNWSFWGYRRQNYRPDYHYRSSSSYGKKNRRNDWSNDRY